MNYTQEQTIELGAGPTPETLPPIGATVTVESLMHAADPDSAANVASSRLIALVAEARAGSVVTWQAARGSSGLVTMSVITSDGALVDGVRWALEPVAATRVRTSLRSLPTAGSSRHITEIRALAPIAPGGRLGFGAALQTSCEPGPGTRGWPIALKADSRELLEIFRYVPDVELRAHLAPVDLASTTALSEEVRRSWPSPTDQSVDHYLGRPVAVRVLIASSVPELPARTRVLIASWARHLDLVALGRTGDAAVDRIWDGQLATIADKAIPAGLALAIVRIPAIGPRPITGFRSRPRPAEDVALTDTLPTAHRPVRLGSALGPTGRSTSVRLDVEDLLRHLHVLGQTGTGKSSLLAALAKEITALGLGLTVIESHGTTCDRIAAEADPEVAARIRVVRFGDLDNPMPMNPFASAQGASVEMTVAGLTELLHEIFDPHSQGVLGPRWERWFALMTAATVELLGDRASLTAVGAVSRDQKTIRRVAAALKDDNQALASRLMSEYGIGREAETAEVLAWAISKFQRLIGSPQMRAVLGTGHDALRLAEHIDSDRVLLVDLAMPALGAPAARTLGTLLIQQLWTAATSRALRSRPHVVLLDEAHMFQHGATPSVLSEGRKFGLGMVIAHQYSGQLAPSLLASLEGNAGGLIAFRSSIDDAPRLTARLGSWQPSELTRIPSLRAATSISRDGVPTAAFTLRVDHNDRMRRRTTGGAKQLDAITLRSREELCDPYRDFDVVEDDAVEAAIQLRLQQRPEAEPSFLDRWAEERRRPRA